MLASGARFPADRLRSSLRASRGGAAPAKAYRVAMGVAELGRQRKGCFRAVNSKSGRLGVADRHHDLALPSWSMSSPTPTILLDLDGTPIDSQPGILSSCRAALRALGHEPEASLDISAIIGPPIDDVMRALLESYADDRIAEAVAAYRADYGQNGLFDSLPYSGIIQALAEMQRAGARLYLATSKRTLFAQQILEHLDLTIFFDGIYGSETGGALDHKPELISHILARHATRASTGCCSSVSPSDRKTRSISTTTHATRRRRRRSACTASTSPIHLPCAARSWRSACSR
jgi:phosphoglycolate phosphatase